MEIFEGTPRERNLLIGLGVVVIAFVAWLLLRGGGGAAVASEPDLDRALRDLQTVETALAARPADMGAAAELAPFDRSALIASAQAAGLTLSRVEPGDDGELTVTFGDAPSSAVLNFLRDLTRTTTATITLLEMDASAPPDVEARVRLAPQPL